MPIVVMIFQISFITVVPFVSLIPSVKIPREEMLEILDKTVTAPSSVNMQPWRFVVVDSEEGKINGNLLSATMVCQNKTSSAMVLIFADLKKMKRRAEENLW